MSPRGARNKLFSALTPQTMKDIFHSHGRVIGNAISYSREMESPFLFYTAARRKKGPLSGLMRVLKLVGDGLDGFIAAQDKDFKTATPEIVSLKQFRSNVWIHGHPIIDTLRNTAGAALDHDTDQIAQMSDQIGNFFARDLKPSYVALNIGRNLLIKRFRAFYTDLGGEAINSLPSGQAKTLIMDTHQAAESFGLIESRPAVRSTFTAIGMAATTYSFVDAVSSMEKTHLLKDYDTEKLGMLSAFTLGVSRYASRNMPNVEIMPAYLDKLPLQPLFEELTNNQFAA